MPIVTLLAGPNGAGKTRYSEFLVNKGLLPTKPLNLDLLREEAILELQYDMAIDAKLPRKIDTLFLKCCENAILHKQNFCYECNFRTNQVKNVELFEKAGYTLHLVFFLLNTVQQSSNRVQYRVANQEGNPVGIESIHANFYEGLRNLDNHFQDFNRVLIIDNSVDLGNPSIQLEVHNQRITVHNFNFPSKELQPHLPKIAKLVRDRK